MRKQNKKGNAILDGMTILVSIFIMASVAVFGLKLFTELNTDLQADPDPDMDRAQAMSQSLFNKYPILMDNIVLFAFSLLIIFTLISVFILDTHPIFFIVTVMLLVGLFLVSILLANTYEDMMNDSEFSGFANQFPFTSWIMGHLVEEMIAVGFMLTIVLFIKYRAL